MHYCIISEIVLDSQQVLLLPTSTEKNSYTINYMITPNRPPPPPFPPAAAPRVLHLNSPGIQTAPEARHSSPFQDSITVVYCALTFVHAELTAGQFCDYGGIFFLFNKEKG